MRPDKNILRRLTFAIVDCVQPERIVLFGSAASGKMYPQSDIDLMVVMPDPFVLA